MWWRGTEKVQEQNGKAITLKDGDKEMEIDGEKKL